MEKYLKIQTGGISVEILNPANTCDEHFSTRFSHAGYITKIEVNGEEKLSRAVEEFHPFHGEGFPDEFEKPLGYNEAKADELFVKIGVGAEKKREEKPYTNWDMHEVAMPAETVAKRIENGYAFIQNFVYNGYGYYYEKKITVENGKIKISHFLKNTGLKNIDTLWYSHAFLRYDLKAEYLTLTVSEDCEIFNGEENITSCGNGVYEIPINEITKKGICYNWHAEKTDNIQKLEKYVAKGDYGYNELQVYMNDRIISVEPKLKIYLKRNESKEWATEYEF